MYEYKARCLKVIDGDTIDVIIDLGLRITTTQRVRVWGVDTPERGQEGFSEATEFTRAFCLIIYDDPPLNEYPLRITTVKPHDKYGRWLAQVGHNGLDLGFELIRNELGVAFMMHLKDYG